MIILRYVLGWPVMVAEHSGWTGFLSSSWSLKTANSSSQSQSGCGNTSKREQMSTSSATAGQFADLRFNGSLKVLYWADVSAEMAFVVPTEWNLRSEVDGNCCSQNTMVDNALVHSGTNVWTRHQPTSQEGVDILKKELSVPPPQRNKNLTLELESNSKSKEPVPPTRRKMAALKPTLLAQATAKIFLVWLESFEDHINFPIGKQIFH